MPATLSSSSTFFVSSELCQFSSRLIVGWYSAVSLDTLLARFGGPLVSLRLGVPSVTLSSSSIGWSMNFTRRALLRVVVDTVGSS